MTLTASSPAPPTSTPQTDAEPTPPAAASAAQPPAAAPASSAPVTRPPLATRTVVLAVVLSVSATVLLILGFFVYAFGFSRLSESRAQHALKQQLAHELSNAIAPTGPTGEGNPVAALEIPALHIHNLIVVEGARSRDLMAGPGHLPGTVLPGQPGVSAIYGKRYTFGAPFASLLKLKLGDTITVVTGQGRQRYSVSSFGDSKHPAPVNSPNGLRLLTASSEAIPGHIVIVEADLVSAVQTGSGKGLPPVTGYEQPLGRDTAGSYVPLLGWTTLLLLTAVLATVLFVRGPPVARWPGVLCLAPVAVAVLWSVYENAAGLLPNLQ